MIHIKNISSALSLCLLWLLCSCEQEHENFEANRVAANFTPAIAEIAQVETSPAESWGDVTTRVDNNQWTNNDIIGIIALNADGSSITADGFRQYEPNTTNSTRTQLIPVRDDELVDQTIYFPTNGDEVTFTAFAPYQRPDNNTVTYELDGQSTTSNIMESLDFIFHRGQKAYSQASPIVAMNFRHKLSRVVINLIRGSGYDSSLAGTVAEIQGVYTSVSCNVFNGNISALGDGNINPYRSTTADDEVTFQAIVAPQSDSDLSAENRILVFTVNNQIYSQEIPQNWETGKSYTYNFTLDASGITLTGSTVLSWGAGTVAWNGNYYLRIDQKELSLSSAGSATNKLVMVSNYASNPVITFRESEDPNSNIITTWLITPALTKTTSGTEHTYTLTYTSTANTADRSTPRVGYIHIAAATVTAVVKVAQAGHIEPESNCYILPPGGNTIYIPVSRANTFTAGTIGDNTNFSWELVWTDVTGNGTNGAPHADAAIADVSNEGTRGPTGYLAITSGSKEGNAVIAVTVGAGAERIKWSWHIWVTKYNPTAMAKSYTNTNGVTNIFMDRNLGALNSTNSTTPTMGTPESLGLHYQWGRKDPFPNSNSTTATSEKTVYTSDGTTTVFTSNRVSNGGTGVPTLTTVQNPFMFYYNANAYTDWCSDDTDGNTRWGYSPFIKSIYDPCPVGWRVADRYAWLGHTTSNFIYTATPGGRYHEQTGWYPRAGNRTSGSGSLSNVHGGASYWTAVPYSALQSYHVCFTGTYVDVTGDYNVDRTHGLSIRCVVE